VRIALLVHQSHVDTGSGRLAAAVGRRRRVQLPVAQVGRLIGVEIGVHRIVRDHRGQHAGTRDEIAGGDERARHMAIDRGAHFGELAVQARRGE
jgi:hypothetical protein